jgi:hypothetical protein
MAVTVSNYEPLTRNDWTWIIGVSVAGVALWTGVIVWLVS